MKIVPVRALFPYNVEFIPRRSRNSRTLSKMAETAVGLRSIQANEAPVAYRLHYPRLDRRPLLKLAKIKHFYDDLVRAAKDIVVISYDGNLWSPLQDVGLDPNFADEMNEFLEGLSDGSELSCMESLVIPRDQGAIDAARSIINDGHDAASASANSRIYHNFLICDGVPFVRRGVPVFVKRKYSDASWEIGIGDAPPDRSSEPRESVRSSMSWDYDEEHVRSGSTWLPNQQDAARAAAHPCQAEIPTIQSFVDPPSSDLIGDIRIDAIMRKSKQFLRLKSSSWKTSKASRESFAQLDLACGSYGSDVDMSSRRLRALLGFIKDPGWETETQFDEIKRELSELLTDFQDQKLPDPRLLSTDSRCGLTEAEESALERMF